MFCDIDLQLHGELHEATWCDIISVIQMRLQPIRGGVGGGGICLAVCKGK